MQEEFLDQIKTQLKTGMTEFLAQVGILPVSCLLV